MNEENGLNRIVVGDLWSMCGICVVLCCADMLYGMLMSSNVPVHYRERRMTRRAEEVYIPRATLRESSLPQNKNWQVYEQPIVLGTNSIKQHCKQVGFSKRGIAKHMGSSS
jgi:hypothetical protein